MNDAAPASSGTLLIIGPSARLGSLPDSLAEVGFSPVTIMGDTDLPDDASWDDLAGRMSRGDGRLFLLIVVDPSRTALDNMTFEEFEAAFGGPTGMAWAAFRSISTAIRIRGGGAMFALLSDTIGVGRVVNAAIDRMASCFALADAIAPDAVRTITVTTSSDWTGPGADRVAQLIIAIAADDVAYMTATNIDLRNG